MSKNILRYLFLCGKIYINKKERFMRKKVLMLLICFIRVW